MFSYRDKNEENEDVQKINYQIKQQYKKFDNSSMSKSQSYQEKSALQESLIQEEGANYQLVVNQDFVMFGDARSAEEY